MDSKYSIKLFFRNYAIVGVWISWRISMG